MADFIKDQHANLDYALHLHRYLPTSVTVTSATVINSSVNFAVMSHWHTTSSTTALVGSGTAGVEYPITFRFYMSNSTVDERTINIEVRDK